MHVVLLKQPINQFKPGKQSPQQKLRAYCPTIYTVPSLQLDRDRTEIENYTTINQNLTSTYRPLSKNWFPGVCTIDQKHFWSCICHVPTEVKIISDKMHLNNIGPESIHFSQKNRMLIPNIKHQRINGKNWTDFIIDCQISKFWFFKSALLLLDWFWTDLKICPQFFFGQITSKNLSLCSFMINYKEILPSKGA